MRTIYGLVSGVPALQHVVNQLIERSCWFAVEPRPGNEWAISVKEENKTLLDKLIDTSPA